MSLRRRAKRVSVTQHHSVDAQRCHCQSHNVPMHVPTPLQKAGDVLYPLFAPLVGFTGLASGPPAQTLVNGKANGD